MSEGYKSTPYADDALRIDGDTSAGEVREFVENRTRNPIVLEDLGITVWDYNTHEPDMEELVRKANGLHRDRYVIPYQVTAVWSYMSTLLPRSIRKAEFLVYSQTEGTYKAYTNYHRTAAAESDEEMQADLEHWLAAHNVREEQ